MVFPTRSVPRCYQWDNWSNESVVSSLVNEQEVSWEAEERPLLRTVTRKRLVKADWEDLAFVLVICKMWSLAICYIYLYLQDVCISGQ
jgi:hypothetical protein